MDFPTTWCICRQRRRQGKAKAKQAKRINPRRRRRRRRLRSKRPRQVKKKAQMKVTKALTRKTKSRKERQERSQRKRRRATRKEKRKFLRTLPPRKRKSWRNRNHERNWNKMQTRFGLFVSWFPLYLWFPPSFPSFERRAGGEICPHQVAKCATLVGKAGWIVWPSLNMLFTIQT